MSSMSTVDHDVLSDVDLQLLCRLARRRFKSSVAHRQLMDLLDRLGAAITVEQLPRLADEHK